MSGQKNAYFANSPNTSHRPRFALASIRKATPRPAFDGELRKAIKAKNSGSCEKGSVVLGWSVQRVVSARCFYWWYQAETDFDQSESVLWHLRVAEGDHLSERSEGGKLPQHKTRALAVLRKLKTLFGGASGGMQGGRSVDIVNTTGNQEQVAALPRRQRLISVSFRPATASPMAAQTRKAEFGIRKLAGRSPITGPTLPRAAQASQTPVRRRVSRPQGRKIKESSASRRRKQKREQTFRPAPA